jgi:hypothetical protein
LGFLEATPAFINRVVRFFAVVPHDFALTFSVKCLVDNVKRNVDKRRERVGLETFNNLYVRRFDTSSDVYIAGSKRFDDDFVIRISVIYSLGIEQDGNNPSL